MTITGDIASLLSYLISQNDKEKYIVGAGNYGRLLGEILDFHNINWHGYFDRKKISTDINGKKVFGYENISEYRSGLFIISSVDFQHELVQEVKLRGISAEHIIVAKDESLYRNLPIIAADEHLKLIAGFRNKYKGNRCIIVGNGPSLRIEDLQKIKGEYSFASNSIYALYVHTDWRPDFYFSTDPIGTDEYARDPKTMDIICNNCKYFFTQISSAIFESRFDRAARNIRYIRMDRKYDSASLPLFSEDCQKVIYIGGTVTYYCIQMAVYMGFEEIYFTGMDCDYPVEFRKDGKIETGSGLSHQILIEREEERYYKTYQEKYGNNTRADINLQINAYKSAKKYADSHGIKIYNATRGGKLEVFDRVDFDAVF